jgi:hypothetical protein
VHDWSQVEVNRWMLRKEVDPEADASLAVIAHIWSEAENGGSWRWRVELSDAEHSTEIIADRAGSEAQARQFAEIAADEALVNLRENVG